MNEVAWLVQPGEREAKGRPHCGLQLPCEGKQRDRHLQGPDLDLDVLCGNLPIQDIL